MSQQQTLMNCFVRQRLPLKGQRRQRHDFDSMTIYMSKCIVLHVAFYVSQKLNTEHYVSEAVTLSMPSVIPDGSPLGYFLSTLGSICRMTEARLLGLDAKV